MFNQYMYIGMHRTQNTNIVIQYLKIDEMKNKKIPVGFSYYKNYDVFDACL